MMQFISSILKRSLIKSGQLEVEQVGIAQTGSGGIAFSLFMVFFQKVDKKYFRLSDKTPKEFRLTSIFGI